MSIIEANDDIDLQLGQYAEQVKVSMESHHRDTLRYMVRNHVNPRLHKIIQENLPKFSIMDGSFKQDIINLLVQEFPCWKIQSYRSIRTQLYPTGEIIRYDIKMTINVGTEHLAHFSLQLYYGGENDILDIYLMDNCNGQL